jgi:hypothetical protein
MFYTILADGIIALHLAYVAFAVVGQLLILIGLALHWNWVRNLRFRVIHLVMVEVVALEGGFGIKCPLTDLEDALRAWGRGETYSGWTRAAPNAPAMEEYEPALQPVVFDEDPIPPVLPPAPEPEKEPESTLATTFVGRLLGSILFVSVPQQVLDRWYIRFGALTLLVFVGFPPRLGAWSFLGFCGMVLLWIASLFILAAWYDLKLGHSIANADLPLEIGVAMFLLGAQCAFLAYRQKTTSTHRRIGLTE